MQSDHNDIDGLFRNAYENGETGKEHLREDWEKLNRSLNEQDPKPKSTKRITRRLIKYLGLVALVTTVSYFVVSEKKRSQKQFPVQGSTTKAFVKPVSGTIVKRTPTLALPASPIVAVPFSLPVKKKNNGGINVTKLLYTVSDTVFQQTTQMANKAPSSKIADDFYKGLREPVQVFTIDPLKDTLLFGRNGTAIRIPARIFRDMQLKPVTTPVNFELTECYSYHDMIVNDLSTTSGDEQLVTGGMLKLKAFSGDKELIMGDFRGVDIMMPMENYDPQMQLFKGAAKQSRLTQTKDKASLEAITSRMDWQPAGQLQAYQNLQEYNERKSIKVLEFRQVIKGEKEKYNGSFIVKAGEYLKDEKIKQLLQQKYYNQFDKLSIERTRSFENGVSARNTNSMVTKTGFVAVDSIVMEFKKAMEEKLVSDQDSIAFVKQLENDWIIYQEKRKTDSIAYIKKKEFDKSYSFNIRDLGWINCDKFYDKTQPRSEFSIKIDDENVDGQNGNYKMIFVNLKSVLAGHFNNGRVDFGSVPAGQVVQIVCVAPGKKNGAVACIKAMRTDATEMVKLKFELVDITSFKEKLLKL